MRVIGWGRVPGLGLLGMALACGSDSGGTTQPPGPPAAVAIQSGDNQDWYFDNALPLAYGVRVSDAGNRSVPGVTVAWAVTAGAGSVSATQSTSNANGIASTIHTLGSSAALQTVTATVASLPAVTFTANAAAPPTTAAVTVDNNFFSPQHVVVQTGGTVTWTWNSGGTAHNVTYTSGPMPRPPGVTTVTTGAHPNTITLVGRYDYVCTLHAGMTGSVTVVN
jgi:plastocyanin